MRHPNWRLVKKDWLYTIEEIATCLGVYWRTVSAWIRAGLPTVDARKPALILGRELIDFLKARKAKTQRHCEAGEMFCLRCREPRRPAGDIVRYEAYTEMLGQLAGVCPSCGRRIYRRVSRLKLDQVLGNLKIVTN
jgi:hypothetical protein